MIIFKFIVLTMSIPLYSSRDIGVDRFFKIDFKDVGWGELIRLAQDRDRWRALVNTVVNLRVLAPPS
jgi:hypothetical protein